MPKGHEGLVFMTALAVNNSGTGVGFLEGCPHLFDPPDAAWPGILLGSGTEDYFDSGWYFNAGEFRLPVAGDTHLKMKGAPWWGINTSANVSEWSACEHLLFKLLVPSETLRRKRLHRPISRDGPATIFRRRACDLALR